MSTYRGAVSVILHKAFAAIIIILISPSVPAEASPKQIVENIFELAQKKGIKKNLNIQRKLKAVYQIVNLNSKQKRKAI